MRNTLASKQIELVDLEEAMWKDQIALDTLLGVPEVRRQKAEDTKQRTESSRQELSDT
jgi:hypothetical protein